VAYRSPANASAGRAGGTATSGKLVHQAGGDTAAVGEPLRTAMITENKRFAANVNVFFSTT
jgi:hypothetical protein